MKCAVYEAQQFGSAEIRMHGRTDPFMELAPISLERFKAHDDYDDDTPAITLLSVKKLQV